MIKNISIALAAFAVVTFAGLSGQASAQGCASCASSAPILAPAPVLGPAVQGCSSCNSAAGSGFASRFASPTASKGCGLLGCRHGHGKGSGHLHNLKNKIDHQASLNAKIAARNDAWPLPFACADHRDYRNIWNVMLNSGHEVSCVLDGNYFTDANRLNRLGIDRVSGIAENMPSADRVVFVNRTANDSVNQARLASARETISTYYSHRGPVDVRLSDKLPRSIAGAQVQDSREKYLTGSPPPRIEVGTGESINQAVGGQ